MTRSIRFLLAVAVGLTLAGGTTALALGAAERVVTDASTSMDGPGRADQGFLDEWSADTHYSVSTPVERYYTLAAGSDVCQRLALGDTPTAAEQRERAMHPRLTGREARVLVSAAHAWLCPPTAARRDAA